MALLGSMMERWDGLGLMMDGGMADDAATTIAVSPTPPGAADASLPPAAFRGDGVDGHGGFGQPCPFLLLKLFPVFTGHLVQCYFRGFMECACASLFFSVRTQKNQFVVACHLSYCPFLYHKCYVG